jgi:hypothetical protein
MAREMMVFSCVTVVQPRRENFPDTVRHGGLTLKSSPLTEATRARCCTTGSFCRFAFEFDDSFGNSRHPRPGFPPETGLDTVRPIPKIPRPATGPLGVVAGPSPLRGGEQIASLRMDGMQYTKFPAWLTVGLLLGLSGCYHYGYSPYGAPYGNYGPGAYPVAPGGGGYVSPSPPYAPSNGSPGMSPTPIAPPSGPAWEPAPGGSQPGNQAPPYNPTPGGPVVPDPIENGEDKPFGGGAPPGASLSPMIEPVPVGLAAPPNSPSGVQLQPIETDPSYSPIGSTASNNVVDNSDPFEPPTTTNSGDIPARQVTMSQAQNPKLKPYGYETRNYSWLRGFVDYDPQDNRWVMIYSTAPSPKDRYGGSITLGDHRSIGKITPGAHVFVQGEVDPSSLDQHGKPIYKIEKVTLLGEPGAN